MNHEPKEMRQEETLDVFSVIRSPEIREYYWENVRLDIWEKKQLILCSYLSMTQKIRMAKQLALQGTEQERKVLLEACGVLEKCMADIFEPEEPTVFAVSYVVPDFNFPECRFEEKSELEEFFATAEELLASIQKCYESGEEGIYVRVNVIQLPQIGKLKQPFDFTVFWLDGCWQVKDILLHHVRVTEDEAGSAEWQANYFYDTYTFEHFPLPFEDGCGLKLQTPFMEKPFYGILDSQYDGVCEWHQYLWDEEEAKLPEVKREIRKSVVLHEQFLGSFSGYSPLDWTERA